jgi:hypothetical protein
MARAREHQFAFPLILTNTIEICDLHKDFSKTCHAASLHSFKPLFTKGLHEQKTCFEEAVLEETCPKGKIYDLF